MSQGAVTSGLVRVTVASGTRRVDLVLPGSVPVAELLPELARSVGLLDPTRVHGGYRVLTPEGRALEPDAGLTLQGVEDGHVLLVSAGADEEPPPVYDDVVEAMAAAVERELAPWQPSTGRRTALAAAALLLGIGVGSLAMQHGSLRATVAAGFIGAVLCVVAIVLSRVRREREAAIVVAWLGTAYVAAAGLLLAPADAAFWELPLAAAGIGAVLAGLVCLVGLGELRMLALPPVVVGAAATATGLAVAEFGVAPRPVLLVGLVAIVIGGSLFPWVALSVTGRQADPPDGEPVDADAVVVDMRFAHEILLAISATVGLALVLISPVAVAAGLAGTLLVVAAALVVMLRARQYRAGSEVLAALGSGVLALAVTALAVLMDHPAWRPTLAVVLALLGVGVLVVLMTPAVSAMRRGRIGDVAETVALLSLLPLLVVAVGLIG